MTIGNANSLIETMVSNFTVPIPYVSIRPISKLINAFILHYLITVSEPGMSNLVVR